MEELQQAMKQVIVALDDLDAHVAESWGQRDLAMLAELMRTCNAVERKTRTMRYMVKTQLRLALGFDDDERGDVPF